MQNNVKELLIARIEEIRIKLDKNRLYYHPDLVLMIEDTLELNQKILESLDCK